MSSAAGSPIAVAITPPEQLSARIAAAIAEGSVSLPVVDTVTTEVIAIAQSDRADAARLSGLIHRHASLAGEIVRIANSPMYRPRSPILSLQQAIARLGLGTVAEVALGLSAKDKLFRVPGYDDEVKKVWRHSAIAAAFAKEIARSRRRNVESAFLCALLHDVGRPVVIGAAIELGKRDGGPIDRELVMALIGPLHEEAGRVLAAKWNLPSAVVASIGMHHATTVTGAEVDAVWTTHLADELAHFAENEPPDEPTLRSSPAVAALNLYSDAIDTLVAFAPKAIAFAEVIA